MIYEQTTGKELPKDNLILPLQYHLFNNLHHCVIFVQPEEELGKGASKQVQKALVKELIGRVPSPEIASLRGKEIVLYRPRENAHAFINDIIAIVKLNQMPLTDYKLRSHIVKIKGHSLYITEEYQGTEADFSKLLYEGYLKLTPDLPSLLAVLKSSLGSACSSDVVEQMMDELLSVNDLINSPFMIGDILPLSVYEAFAEMTDDEVLTNVYQMIYSIAAYAAEGIFFRDLQPDNFRVNMKKQVKLSDPSYIDASVAPASRFVLFIRQTTAEYLPNAFSVLNLKNDKDGLTRYFGEFTAGVCIGMLERVLRRIFLPGYMERYDQLYLIKNPTERVEKADQLKFQEDLDFFRDVVEGLPSPENFQQYEKSILTYMGRDSIFSEELFQPIAKILRILRQFSYPVFTEYASHSLLQAGNRPISIEQVHLYIQRALGIIPEERTTLKNTQRLTPVQNPFLAKTIKNPSMVTRRFQRITRKAERETIEKTIETNEDSVIFGEEKEGSVIFGEEKECSVIFGEEKEDSVIFGEEKEDSVIFGEEKESSVIFGEESTSISQETTSKSSSKYSPPYGTQTAILDTPSIKRDDFTNYNVSKIETNRSKDSKIIKGAYFSDSSQGQSSPEMPIATDVQENLEEKYKKDVDRIFAYVDQNLQGIKSLLENSGIFPYILKEHLLEQFKNNAEFIFLQQFFEAADALIHNQEVEIELLRQIQPLIKNQIYIDLENNAPIQLKDTFRSTSFAAKCKKIIGNYLVLTVKTRFLMEIDPNKNIFSLLPSENENILHFILKYDCVHSFTSFSDIAKNIVQDLKTGRRI